MGLSGFVCKKGRFARLMFGGQDSCILSILCHSVIAYISILLSSITPIINDWKDTGNTLES